MNDGPAMSQSEIDALRDEFIRDAEGLFRSMASECPTCNIPRSRCPECWAFTAKLYLRKLDRIRALVQDPTRSLLPEEPKPEAARAQRFLYLVAVLRAAGRPIPASGIRIPGIDNDKSLKRFLRDAVTAGYCIRSRQKISRAPGFRYIYQLQTTRHEK